MNNQNIEDKALTTLAFVIGLALIDNLSSTEQNAVGNWLMLVAQILCTNAFYKQVMQERGFDNNKNDSEQTIAMMQKMMDALQKEIDEIKKGN